MFNNLIDRLHNTVDTHEVNIIEDLNTDIKEDILEQQNIFQRRYT